MSCNEQVFRKQIVKGDLDTDDVAVTIGRSIC